MLLLDDLARTKSELENAYATFENMVEPDLIDASIYEVKAGADEISVLACPGKTNRGFLYKESSGCLRLKAFV